MEEDNGKRQDMGREGKGVTGEWGKGGRKEMVIQERGTVCGSG